MSLIIVEVDDAEALAGELFSRDLRPPDPEAATSWLCSEWTAAPCASPAYIHYTAWGYEAWLCGGLCIDRQPIRAPSRRTPPDGSGAGA
jgi:hypothetical protein